MIGGGGAVVFVVGGVLAIAGVIGWGLPFAALVVAACLTLVGHLVAVLASSRLR